MAKYALVYSTQDPAGSGAAKRLVEMLVARGCSVPRAVECFEAPTVNAIIAGFKEDVIHFDFLDQVLKDVDAYIVLSRHSSASGEPTLSLHHPGNPTAKAEHGGRPRELAVAYPSLAKTLFTVYREAAARRNLLSEYRFTLEATHHGPTSLLKPIVFVEIGSTPDRWRDERAQEALAEAVVEALRRGPSRCKPAVGVGDTHYPRSHTRLMLETDMCYGHILAKYVLNEIDEQILVQAVERSVDRVEAFVLQKPPSKVRKMVESVASRLGIDVIRV